jgi:hypothetical protein
VLTRLIKWESHKIIEMDTHAIVLVRVDNKIFRARGRVVAHALSFKSEVSDSRPNEVNEFLSIHLILPAAVGPGIYSASDRNGYQKQRKFC